jgi:hypothetical protein
MTTKIVALERFYSVNNQELARRQNLCDDSAWEEFYFTYLKDDQPDHMNTRIIDLFSSLFHCQKKDKVELKKFMWRIPDISKIIPYAYYIILANPKPIGEYLEENTDIVNFLSIIAFVYMYRHEDFKRVMNNTLLNKSIILRTEDSHGNRPCISFFMQNNKTIASVSLY